MLNIYYGSENCDKEKFMFENIDPDRKTIIIVPDQFSLQMEKDALRYFYEKTQRTALIDLMVADFASLGRKVAAEAGGAEPALIDKYGRHMLLSLIIDRLAESGDLSIYGGMCGRSSFASQMNQIISEMKRFGTTSRELEQAEKDAGGLLGMKLRDISKIYDVYAESIDGRFTDSEDYIRFYGSLMEKSSMISDSVVWVYGFDTFTPLNMEVLQKILCASCQMNVVMTYDDCSRSPENRDARSLTVGAGEGLFDLTGHVMDNLREMAREAGIPFKTERIHGEKKNNVWGAGAEERFTLAEVSNIYAEADRAAAHITELVRDKGYRYSDIAVICNDMDVRGGVLKRTFDRWGIPAFADRKRRVLHQPVVRFLMSFLDVIAGGFESDTIMEMVSAGLMGWSRQEEELLSNYVYEAKIRGNRWRKEFTWVGRDDRGNAVYSEEELSTLNRMRSALIKMIDDARNEMGRRNSAGEKINGLYEFLERDFSVRQKISELMEKQERLGLAEGAAETAQSWNMVCGLFTQILRIIGSENISNSQLKEILTAGLREMEIGLVPANPDCVIIGTLQRTRISRIRSLVVVAANEGIMPMQEPDAGLLTRRELEFLEELKLNISKREDVRRREEQLAIYRMFSMPEDDVFVSCSMADDEGKKASPSGIFSVLKEMKGTVSGDLGSDGAFEMVTSRKGTLSYMASAIQSYIENGRIDDIWLHAINWYARNDADDIEGIKRGLSFSSKAERLGQEMAEALYFGDRDSIYMSASRLETYSKCPFKYFIERGLRANEPRGFEIDGRSRGDVYHEALQKLSEALMPGDGISVTDPKSPWMTVTEEEVRKKTEDIIRNKIQGYREGVYINDEESRLQAERIISVCGDMAWAMIDQVRKSRISSMYIEESFGRDGNILRPAEIQLGGGKKAVLVGRIDRIDVMDIGGDGGRENKAVRVIDYKTGSDRIDLEQIRKGYKLQLMVYMNAVRGLKPAGVFYFKIGDIDLNADQAGTPSAKHDTVEDRIVRGCRLEGVFVDDESVIRAMDETISPGEASSAIPVKQLVKGELKKSGPGEMLSEKDFNELCDMTAEHVRRICREISVGRIDIAPKMERGSGGNTKTSCSYCGYRSICLFDTSFRDCKYEIV